MCFARGMYRSRNTSDRPNAAPASRCASASLVVEIGGLGHDAHAAPAAAEAGLDHQREADARGFGVDALAASIASSRFRNRRHARCLREPLGRCLVAEHVEMLRRRSDEKDACRFARARELGAFREKAIPGMNRVDALFPGDCDDRVDIQIRPHRLAALRRTDQERLVGFEAVQRKAILVAVHGNSAQTELRRGSEAADGDLGAVGNEQFPHVRHERVRCPRGFGSRQASMILT